jgi:hypothetical protein
VTLLPAAALLLAAASAGTERGVGLPRAGKAMVELDADVYEHARPDLGDLRVRDDQGREVPYLLQRAFDEPEPGFLQPRTLNRGLVKGVGPTATLQFEAPVLKTELVLSLSGDNFRRRVIVEGRNRGETAWTTLTEGAYVFAVPGPPAARYESVRLPENNYQFLRLTVEAASDEEEPVVIRDVWVRPEPRRRPREVPRTPRWSRAEDEKARETLVTVDLGARHQPFRALQLEVGPGAFFRGVEVQARRDPPSPGAPIWWQPLGEGAVYRYVRGDDTHESLRLEVSGRERILRLRIRNRDDLPLELRAVTVLVPVERLVFEGLPGRSYRLAYGDPRRPPPQYDLQRTVGDAALWVAQAEVASLGPAQRVTVEARPAPWTERHPALLWAGLVTVVAALAAVTWRALRAA